VPVLVDPTSWRVYLPAVTFRCRPPIVTGPACLRCVPRDVCSCTPKRALADASFQIARRRTSCVSVQAPYPWYVPVGRAAAATRGGGRRCVIRECPTHRAALRAAPRPCRVEQRTLQPPAAACRPTAPTC
jgi:hypothetical protein